MTMPASGAISLAQVNTELGLSSSANISLNQANVRGLFSKPSGIISMSDGYGKGVSTFATLNPLDKHASAVLSNGNRTVTFSGPNQMVRANAHEHNDATANVWRYFEVTCTGNIAVGVASSTASLSSSIGANNQSSGIRVDGRCWVYPDWVNFASGVTGTVLGIAKYDANGGGGGIRLYVNGNHIGGFSMGQIVGYPAVSCFSGSGSATFNAGQVAFTYYQGSYAGWTI